jgi:protein SCO1/2
VSELHQEFSDPSLKFVGISVDPDTDTPQVLERYAQHFFSLMKVRTAPRWYMLQMHMDSVKQVAINGFLLAQGSMNNAEDDPNLHSTRLVLIDRQGKIRGYYDGIDTTNHASLSAALQQLLAE